jgi:hypothetical protein
MPQTTSVKLNFALVASPTVAGSANVSRSGSFLLICLLALGVFSVASSTSNRLLPTWACAALPAGGLWVALRPNHPSVTTDALFFALAIGVLACAVYVSHSRSSAFISIHIGVGILLVAAVAFRLAGIGTMGTGKLVSGNVFTGGQRVLFTLTGSLVAGPALAALYLVAVPAMLRFTGRYRILQLGLVAPATYVLVQSDRRSALFAALIIGAGVTMAPQMLRLFAPTLVGFTLLIPTTFGVFRDFWQLGGAFTTAIFLPRPGEKANLGGRFGIWSNAMDFYTDRIDGIHQMFGFGTYGHITSGASTTYSSGFGRYSRDRLLTSPHSSVVQILLDGGWVATACFVVAVIYAAWALSRRNSATDLGGLAMITALSAVGMTESSLSPSNGSTTWWALLLIVTIALSREWSSFQENAAKGFGADRNGQRITNNVT